MKTTASYFGAWLATAGLALALAVHAPDEASVMGRLPALMAQSLAHQPLALPHGLPSERTLALITFKRGQHVQADSWIDGMNLRHDPSITWMRMPVVHDPGTATGRQAVEHKLLQYYPADAERARLVPVFTDRAVFVRAVGLDGADQASAVVLNRNGEVLARVQGQFDPDKAQSLRETLQAPPP